MGAAKMLDKLDRKDARLIAICVLVAVVSLYVGVRYFFQAFPEASIEFRYTRDSSTPVAVSFLSGLGLETSDYRHAAVFGFDNGAKTFLEREVGVEETNRLLDTTVRLWRWEHRWFRPLQKEEMSVDVTTRGEVVGFRHLLPEDAAGADLTQEQARSLAERFLSETMDRSLDELSFVEASQEKRPRRTDHTFTWKLAGSEIRGADYRIQVGVHGERIASYREYLKVPDTWLRDYARLRSTNETTGLVDSALLFLTMLAMLVVLALRVRRSDVRWKPAYVLGALIFVLLTLSQLNAMPSELYYYDTTTSYAGFLLGRLAVAVLSGLGAGVLIFLFTASAEPLYRERFPARQSLSSVVRLRALRTKEFFTASLVGITLTCFFFAYENVFYIIANALGAWAPREIPYDDLLSTSFPWVYVLFFGFLPAISEEFISRMFSIPFLEKILRSTVAAVVISAFIWGFGHAAYPNQPFWIRGLEVGLAGIVFGVVLLRFGIMAVVICHFSVDALYTAFVLVRSPNPYYVITGSLSAGFFVLLFLGAAAAYVWRGGFLPAERTNADEGVAPPPPPRARATVPAAPEGYRALGRRGLAAALAAAVVLAALAALPMARFGDWVSFGTTRAAASEAASDYLAALGFDVSSYRRAVTSLDRTDPSAAAYLRQYGKAARFYRDLVPTPFWNVRFFVPGQHEEYRASVDVRDGRVIGFSRTLPEDAPGKTLDAPAALDVAEEFLRREGIDPAEGELKEQTAKDEKARRDHTLMWEFPEEGAGEARVRQEVVIQGDVVGSWGRGVKVPEDWTRKREQSTALTIALRYLKVPLFVLLGGLAIVLLIRKIRAGEMPWKLGFVAGGVLMAAALLRTGLGIDAFWAGYQTSIPASLFIVGVLVSLFLGAVFAALLGIVLIGLAAALFPSAARMFSAPARRSYARDALVAGALALAATLGVPVLLDLLGRLVPSGVLIGGVPMPDSVNSSVPFLSVLAQASSFAPLAAAAVGIVVALWTGYFRRPAVRGVLLAWFVLSFLPTEARRPAEYVLSAFMLVIVALAVVLIIRFVLRDNPLAWLASVFFATGGAGGVRLVAQPAYRVQGLLALGAIAVCALFLLRDALARAPDPAGE